ncbi:MAG TPA: hypothetical protein VNH64_08115 [Parvularculaceae bacterium]|nr:hypothetical protein [Parvularculaceae bacterium]
MQDWALERLREEWRVIKRAPWSFVLALILASALIAWAIWGVFDWRYRDRFESVQTANSALKGQIALLQEKISDAAPVAKETQETSAQAEIAKGEPGGAADFVKWDKRDKFTINEVAYLWYGREPVATNQYGRYWSHDIQQLHDELNHRFFIEKAFEGQTTSEVGDGSGKENHWIPRAALIKWAKERGERPAFLFPEERKKYRDDN